MIGAGHFALKAFFVIFNYPPHTLNVGAPASDPLLSTHNIPPQPSPSGLARQSPSPADLGGVGHQKLRWLVVGLFLAARVEHPSTDQHRCTPAQEADIPVNPLFTRDRLIDVVDA